MDEQQLQEVIQQVAQLLAEGQDPQAIMQMLMESGMDEQTATQIIEAAMQAVQGGGQTPGSGEQVQNAPEASGGYQSGEQGEAGNIVEQALSTLGPEALLALLQSWDQQPQEAKAQIMAQLQQMAGGQAQGGEQAPEAAQGNAVEDAMFGGY